MGASWVSFHGRLQKDRLDFFLPIKLINIQPFFFFIRPLSLLFPFYFFTRSAVVPVNLEGLKIVKSAVSIPMVGNGDIFSKADALNMVEKTGFFLLPFFFFFHPLFCIHSIKILFPPNSQQQ